MTDPYFLRSLRVEGFRGYLQPKTFDFSKKRSLAIFAPNGHGKSSLVDALEFMFSKDGTLDRLGQRAIHNQAGPVALAHNLAELAKIAPKVSIEAISGKLVTNGSRPAVGPKRAMPEVAAVVSACFAVPPIIRGHALRAFVEVHTSEQRYADIANWLQLGPLVDVQKNIRALRTQVKAAAEDHSTLQRLDNQLARETDREVKTWEPISVLSYINKSVLASLDGALSLADLSANDPAYLEVVTRTKAEESKIGLAGLRQIRNAAWCLREEVKNAEGETILRGAIPSFDSAVEALRAAEVKEIEEREKASNAAFENLWKAAEPLFAVGMPIPDACPVCSTPLPETAAGSAEMIRVRCSAHLQELAAYAGAKRELDDAKRAVTKSHDQLAALLSGLLGLVSDSDVSLRDAIVDYQEGITRFPQAAPPSSTGVAEALSKLVLSIGAAIQDIESKQGDHTYGKAKTKIDGLLALESERSVAVRLLGELGKLSEALAEQATIISAEIRKKLQSLLDSLRKPMNEFYSLIQGSSAVPVRLELPAEDDANQQRLNLLIDFAENRKGVQPAGYLSDSQVHSVALALRMAAIRKFNTGAPIIALDDIVTSYDADHRRNIAALIATMFGDWQILLTSHDERFFNYLKDQLEAKAWHFSRIIRLDRDYGPRFADHKVSDEMIEARWKEGQSAANEMRQAEEEWLLSICRDFGASVRIRSLDRAYAYERSELASALASVLKDAKLTPLPVPGIKNRFLDSLIKGEIENFGSHFQAGPYGDGSIGDEKARWEEYKTFRKQFACKKCSRTKFQRPFGLKRPICAHENCETQFEFAAL